MGGLDVDAHTSWMSELKEDLYLRAIGHRIRPSYITAKKDRSADVFPLRNFMKPHSVPPLHELT